MCVTLRRSHSFSDLSHFDCISISVKLLSKNLKCLLS